MDKKLLMVMGGGLLVGGGVFAWYFLAGDAMVKRDAAKKPIAQWEGEWKKARACLLGDEPADADPGDTLRIRAMNDDAPRCSLSELARPEGQGSGIPEIEDAWGEIETAWHALAKAVPDPDAMGPQIVALDHALAKLHHGAGLDAPAAPKATRTIASLTLGPAIAGTRGASIDDTPRDHVLFGAVAGDAGASLVIVRGPTDAVIAPPSVSGTLAVAGAPTWAATATSDAGLSTLAAGPLGPDGHVATPVTVTTSKQELAPVAAVGHGDARLILFSEDTPDAVLLRQVRSTDAGVHWSKPATIAGGWGDRTVVEWLAGAIALSGSTESGDDPTPMWMILDEAATPRVIAAAGQPDTRTCFARTLWHGVADDESKLARLAADGEPTPPLELDDRFDLRACTKDAAAVRVHEQLLRCGATACDGGLAVPNHTGVADVFDGNGAVFAAQAGRLIGVWRTGVAPVYLRAPAGAALAAVVVWNGKPTLAFTTADGLRTAPMP